MPLQLQPRKVGISAPPKTLRREPTALVTLRVVGILLCLALFLLCRLRYCARSLFEQRKHGPGLVSRRFQNLSYRQAFRKFSCGKGNDGVRVAQNILLCCCFLFRRIVLVLGPRRFLVRFRELSFVAPVHEGIVHVIFCDPFLGVLQQPAQMSARVNH